MQNSFIFNQISKLTVNFSPHLRYRNISFCLKFQIPMGHRQFFKVISQNRYFLEMFAMIWKILVILHVRNGSIN